MLDQLMSSVLSADKWATHLGRSHLVFVTGPLLASDCVGVCV
jgi:hypothetical protein